MAQIVDAHGRFLTDKPKEPARWPFALPSLRDRRIRGTFMARGMSWGERSDLNLRRAALARVDPGVANAIIRGIARIMTPANIPFVGSGSTSSGL